jgi:hypothetical protein
LFDDVGLADDHLLQFLLHQAAMLTELLEDVSETTGFGGQRKPLLCLGLYFWEYLDGNAQLSAYASSIL